MKNLPPQCVLTSEVFDCLFIYLFLFTDDDKPSIVDAISRMSSKHPSPKKSATKSVEEVKKDISPADFFGLTPVHVGKDNKVLHSIECSYCCDVSLI